MSSLGLKPGFLVLLAAPLLLNAQADPALSRFIQPGAKALISIDWKHIRQSNVGAMLQEKLNTGAGEGAAINGVAFPGMEFLNDVDRFLISSSGRKAGADESEDTPLLIVAGGHFDLAKVRAALAKFGAKAQLFNSTTVYRPQGKDGKDMAFALIDAQTILAGDAPSVFASIERGAFVAPTQDPNSMIARAAGMGGSYDAWIILTDPEELANNRLADLFSEGQLGADARGFEAGVSLRDGLAADVTVRFENEASATKLTTTLSQLLKLAPARKSGEASLLDMSKKLKFSSEGALAKISLRLTPQELDKNTRVLASMRSKPAASQTVANARPLVQPSPAPVREEKKVIRIEGLDDGPRVIPYQQQ